MRHEAPLRDRAHGRWPGILAALGVPDALLNPRRHQPCPTCGGKDRFRFTNKDDAGLFYCNQCGPISPIDLLMRMKGWDFATAAKEIEAVLGEVPVTRSTSKDDPTARGAMQRLWDSSRPIEAGDFVDQYLAGRGVRQDRYARWLRRSDSAVHETEEGEKSWHPAMVAKILNPAGRPVNIHRTYLTLDGRKANAEPVRKTMWGSIPRGSAVRLFDAAEELGIAEGIETAFSAAALFQMPVWAALNSTLLAGWEPPSETRSVVIFGDNDPKFGGQAAANQLAHRLACRGVAVRIEIPPHAGTDWNDVLLTERRRAA